MKKFLTLGVLLALASCSDEIVVPTLTDLVEIPAQFGVVHDDLDQFSFYDFSTINTSSSTGTAPAGSYQTFTPSKNTLTAVDLMLMNRTGGGPNGTSGKWNWGVGAPSNAQVKILDHLTGEVLFTSETIVLPPLPVSPDVCPTAGYWWASFEACPTFFHVEVGAIPVKTNQKYRIQLIELPDECEGLCVTWMAYSVAWPGVNYAGGSPDFTNSKQYDLIFRSYGQDRTLDAVAPVVTVPEDMTLEATAPTTVVEYFGVAATDDVDGALNATCVPESGARLMVGTTTVTCTATDAAGNEASASFDVTVTDQTPPTLTVPEDIAVDADGATAVVTYTGVSAMDLVDGEVDVTCSPASGDTFPVGETTVTCTAMDSRYNESTATFDVAVGDVAAPVLSLPADFTLDATAATVPLTYQASAVDAADGEVAPVCEPASGTPVGVGITVVNCTATDAAGNAAEGSFTVTVVDRAPPVLTVPVSMTVDATGPTTTVTYDAPSALDAVDGVVAASCSPASGSAFGLGSTVVACTAADNSGNTGSAEFTVTVTDHTAPVLTSTDIETDATGSLTPISFTSVSAMDLVDGALEPVCTPASGSAFQVGRTTVECSATDAAGNTGSTTFQVTVLSAEEQATNLIAAVEQLQLPGQMANSLTSSLRVFGRPSPPLRTQCRSIETFIRKVSQRPRIRGLSSEDQAALIEDAERILAALEC